MEQMQTDANGLPTLDESDVQQMMLEFTIQLQQYKKALRREQMRSAQLEAQLRQFQPPQEAPPAEQPNLQVVPPAQPQ